jgi:hypothetical protein
MFGGSKSNTFTLDLILYQKVEMKNIWGSKFADFFIETKNKVWDFIEQEILWLEEGR